MSTVGVAASAALRLSASATLATLRYFAVSQGSVRALTATAQFAPAKLSDQGLDRGWGGRLAVSAHSKKRHTAHTHTHTHPPHNDSLSLRATVVLIVQYTGVQDTAQTTHTHTHTHTKTHTQPCEPSKCEAT